jgi:hypothetical protein
MNPRLCIDATGVGNPVVEMFRTALVSHPRVEVHAISITAGRSWSVVGLRTYHVAKLELVAAVREALETRRLKLTRRLDGSPIDHADVLKHELLSFRTRITAAANEVFAAREGMHDDLVLSVALPIWLAGLPFLEMRSDSSDGEGVWLRDRETAAIASERTMLAALEGAERAAMELEERTDRERRQREHEDGDDDWWW